MGLMGLDYRGEARGGVKGVHIVDTVETFGGVGGHGRRWGYVGRWEEWEKDGADTLLGFVLIRAHTST